MNKFNWLKGISFGILIWLAAFVIGAILVAMGAVLNVWWMLVLAVIAGALSYIFAGNANPRTTGQAFGYGITWAVIGLVLDLAVTYRFSGTTVIAGMWTYWLGYALVLMAPWLNVGAGQQTQVTA
ncbi:hypothetical protein KGQ24_01025 [Patescibacteria group bacterium]|nr:hypothetical protein [Patescibacteria group bacterium]